jgi:hypothetical protein
MLCYTSGVLVGEAIVIPELPPLLCHARAFFRIRNELRVNIIDWHRYLRTLRGTYRETDRCA